MIEPSGFKKKRKPEEKTLKNSSQQTKSSLHSPLSQTGLENLNKKNRKPQTPNNFSKRCLCQKLSGENNSCCLPQLEELWKSRELRRRVSSGSRKRPLYSCLACRSTRALARRLVQPSCTVLPLATWSLFTRPPTNQRGRRGAWTRCAPSGEDSCCSGAQPCQEEGRGPGQRVAPPGGWDPATLNLIQGTPLGSWVIWVCALLIFFSHSFFR